MVEKRSKYSPSVKEKAPSIIGDLTRIPQENFITEFLKQCEEYDVQPVPTCVINSGTLESRNFQTLSKLFRSASIIGNEKIHKKRNDFSKMEIKQPSPTFRLSFEYPKKLEGLSKIECKGSEVSICILDALNCTMRKYNTITVLRLQNCSINAYGIMQIAQMLTEIGCLRDVNLDMNPNVQENYHLLCVPTGNLLYLSLKLCKITDQGVERIANELKYDDPPNEPRLIGLNLANNHITESGAAHIARMLRTNRSIQSLVLTGNRIRDDGASLIIHELCMFSLEHCEIVDLRRRRYAELMKLADPAGRSKSSPVLASEEIGKADTITGDAVSRKDQRTSRRQSLQKRNRKSLRQESLARPKEEEILTHEPKSSLLSADVHTDLNVHHPFARESVPIKGSVVSTGNFQLQHLNLSFNHLTGDTLKALVNCLYYQSYMMLEDSSRGLLHIFLEGNDFDDDCDEDLTVVEDLLYSRRKDTYKYPVDHFGDLVPMHSETLRKQISGKHLPR